MTYDKFVQIGRIAYIAIGPDQGKLVTILDLIDTNRALVDGPNFQRKALNIKTLYLTKFRVKIPHSARESTVKKAWAKAEIDKKWAESSWAKKLAARKIRESLTDFDRFRLMRAKQTRNRLITLEAGKLRIKQKKANAETKKSAPAAKKPAAKAGKATGKK